MKRLIAAVLAVAVLITVFVLVRMPKNAVESTEPTKSDTAAEAAQKGYSEVRAVWISYLELSMLDETDYSESTFVKKAEEMVDNIKSGGMNTVFLHVRPASDAFYSSNIFPFSGYITGNEGKDPGYDPLEIFCKLAKEAELSVHAWINPFRICSASNWDTRAENNPAKSMPDSIIHVGSGIYYNPADPAVHDLIIRGVKELLERYSIAGIHIDDYFYPDTDPSIDRKFYNSSNTKPLDAWRRDTISSFIHDLYTTVKSFGEEKIFSISPAADIKRNEEKLYADVTLWGKEPGYCDWLIPQLYVGYEHESLPYSKTAAAWNDLVQTDSVRLVFGLSVYKCGETDKNAGSGQNEWLENTDILCRELQDARKMQRYQGFALYSYSYAFGKNMCDISNTEIKNLNGVL